jgi:hypothetical protein
MGYDELDELVSLTQEFCYRQGLLTFRESKMIVGHYGLITGRTVLDFSKVPAEKRAACMALTESIRDGSHPAFGGLDESWASCEKCGRCKWACKKIGCRPEDAK